MPSVAGFQPESLGRPAHAKNDNNDTRIITETFFCVLESHLDIPLVRIS